MKKLDALVAGLKGVGRSKRYLILIYLVNVAVTALVALPLAKVIEDSLGSSVASENLLQGFDDLWGKNFASAAKGTASSFDASVSGIGAVLNGLDAFVQGKLLHGTIATDRGEFTTSNMSVVGIGLAYLLMWTFFAGGLISIFAAQYERPSFLLESARFFPRMLFLGLLAGVLYIVLLRFGLVWLSNLIDELTRETIDERVHFFFTVLKYALLLFVLWMINLIFDYAKIIAVLRDEVNVLTVPLRALGFVFTNFGRTCGLYLVLGGVWIAAMLLYWLVAPGAGQATWTAIIAAFLIGQLYILSRVVTRGLFYASQTALYLGTSAKEARTRHVHSGSPETVDEV